MRCPYSHDRGGHAEFQLVAGGVDVACGFEQHETLLEKGVEKASDNLVVVVDLRFGNHHGQLQDPDSGREQDQSSRLEAHD